MKRSIKTMLIASLIGASSVVFAGSPDATYYGSNDDTTSLLLFGGRIGWQDYYYTATLADGSAVDLDVSGMALGPFLKYGWIYNHLFLGVEGFFNYSFARTVGLLTGTSNPNYNYGLSFQPGYALTPRTIFYGRIGAGMLHIKQSYPNVQLIDFKANQGMFLLGFGVNQAIYKKTLYLGMDYDHAFMSDFTTRSIVPFVGTTIAQTTKVNADIVSLSLSYNFLT